MSRVSFYQHMMLNSEGWIFWKKLRGILAVLVLLVMDVKLY